MTRRVTLGFNLDSVYGVTIVLLRCLFLLLLHWLAILHCSYALLHFNVVERMFCWFPALLLHCFTTDREDEKVFKASNWEKNNVEWKGKPESRRRLAVKSEHR